jgi:O-antigen/teichoic acid export membrane protein
MTSVARPETPEGVDSADESASWAAGTAHRLIALAGGRAVAQVLAMVWFFAAARQLSDQDYGVVATGLAFLAVFSGIGDLGTTRTTVRHVAADERTMWPAFIAAVRIRSLGGLGIAVLTAAAIAIAPVPVDPGIVLLAGAIATVSGITELAFAALRSVGRTRFETGMLVFERGLFLVVGLGAVGAGAGPGAVLGIYLFTNALSAVWSAAVVHRARPADARPSGPFLDAEGRYTAMSFALLVATPRLGPLLVALFASTTAVGVYSVAQRPLESMTLFAIATATPVLPVIRGHLARGAAVHAERVAVATIAATGTAMLPLLAWFTVSPTMVLDLFFGAGRYDGAAIVLRLLSATALTWCFRGVGEFVLLGGERARQTLVITGSGGLLSLAIGVPLVIAHGATGAAIAVLAGELLMVGLLIRAEPSLVGAAARRVYAPGVAVAVASAGSLALLGGTVLGSLLMMVILQVGALALAVRMIRKLEVGA